MNKNKIGITSNCLKVIVLLIMIIDHIGMFTFGKIEYDTYYLLRSIGRIAMPIFAYLVVQGYFYTKDLKRYVFRLFCLAVITQVIIFIIKFLCEVIFYTRVLDICNTLNVVFSYTFSIIIILILDNRKISNNSIIDVIIKTSTLITIIFAYIKLNIEYELRIPFIILGFYIIEKVFMSKEGKLLHKKEYKTYKRKILEKIIYLISIFMILYISIIPIKQTPGCKYATLGSIVLIALYNGYKGKNSKWGQYLFYIIYPLQYIILYLATLKIWKLEKRWKNER